MKRPRWHIRFTWSESLARELRAALPSTVEITEPAMSKEGTLSLDASDFGLLSALRRRLREAGVEPMEHSGLGQESAEELSDASLVRLWSPKPRGNTFWTDGDHPVEQRRCEACEVDGFAVLKGKTVRVRLAKAPEDGIVLLSNANGGMGKALPAPYLFYAMSEKLRDALAHEGLLTGLGLFDIEIKRRPGSRYVGILPEQRLEPMATPHGTNAHQRNCTTCGFVNARQCLYPLYPKTPTPADWFLVAPWNASDIVMSQRVFAWLTGAGFNLFSAKHTRISTSRAGIWPDERERAFVPSD